MFKTSKIVGSDLSCDRVARTFLERSNSSLSLTGGGAQPRTQFFWVLIDCLFHYCSFNSFHCKWLLHICIGALKDEAHTFATLKNESRTSHRLPSRMCPAHRRPSSMSPNHWQPSEMCPTNRRPTRLSPNHWRRNCKLWCNILHNDMNWIIIIWCFLQCVYLTYLCGRVNYFRSPILIGILVWLWRHYQNIHDANAIRNVYRNYNNMWCYCFFCYYLKILNNQNICLLNRHEVWKLIEVISWVIFTKHQNNKIGPIGRKNLFVNPRIRKKLQMKWRIYLFRCFVI